MDLARLVIEGLEDSAEFGAGIEWADDGDIAAMCSLATHGETRVRRVLASVLPLLTHGGPPTPAMIDVAIRLTLDADPKVRDWACLALGGWREVDTRELRDALAARLDDLDREVRSEALLGLALRRDARALPRVRAALSRPSGAVWRLEMLAAGALSDPSLHELVARHQSGWDSADDARTAQLVLRLTDPDRPGEDVVERVAELYRRRARGLADADDGSWGVMSAMLDIAPHRAPEFLDLVLARLAGDPVGAHELREQSALAQFAAEERTRD